MCTSSYLYYIVATVYRTKIPAHFIYKSEICVKSHSTVYMPFILLFISKAYIIVSNVPNKPIKFKISVEVYVDANEKHDF